MSIQPGDIIALARDVDAFLIPQGTPIILPEGEKVVVTQALGGSFTVNIQGNLARLLSKDADAIGAEHDVTESQQIFDGGEVEEEQVYEKIRTCYDPEIPVNILDLGLIYKIDIQKAETKGYTIAVDMTLTAPGCGMGPILVQEVYEKLMTIPNVANVMVELVFDPPWDQSMMTEAAQVQLGLL